MKSAIILHGMPSREEYFGLNGSLQQNKHWLPWIKEELMAEGVKVFSPEFPEPYLPVYENWKKSFEELEVDKDTILIGHSCGAGFILRWLSENKIQVGKVALVAPWIDPRGQLQNDFFNFKIDKDLLSRATGVCIFISKDDDKDILDSFEIIKKELPEVDVRWFENYGHFTFGDMKTIEFPELKNFVLE